MEGLTIDGEGLRFGIVAARFNRRFVDALLERVLATLDEHGVRAEDVETLRAPGSAELPYLASMLAATGEFDCIIALGVVLQGGTDHHTVITHATAEAFVRISCETEVPVINGVVGVSDIIQAEERCMGRLNRGREFALAALEMAEMKVELVRRLDEIEALENPFKDEGDPIWDSIFDDDDDDDDDEQPWKS